MPINVQQGLHKLISCSLITWYFAAKTLAMELSFVLSMTILLCLHVSHYLLVIYQVAVGRFCLVCGGTYQCNHDATQMSDCFSHHCQWWLFIVLWWFAVPYWYHQTVGDPPVKYTIIYYLFTTIISIIGLPTMGDLHYLLGVNWRCYHILILDQHMPMQEQPAQCWLEIVRYDILMIHVLVHTFQIALNSGWRMYSFVRPYQFALPLSSRTVAKYLGCEPLVQQGWGTNKTCPACHADRDHNETMLLWGMNFWLGCGRPSRQRINVMKRRTLLWLWTK